MLFHQPRGDVWPNVGFSEIPWVGLENASLLCLMFAFACRGRNLRPLSNLHGRSSGELGLALDACLLKECRSRGQHGPRSQGERTVEVPPRGAKDGY